MTECRVAGPTQVPAPEWRHDVVGHDPELARVHEAQLALGDGRLGTRGAPLVGADPAAPPVLLAGSYAGSGPDTELAPLPAWARLVGDPDGYPEHRRLDLRDGVLTERGPLSSQRFAALARPGTAVLRATGDPALLAPSGRRTIPGAVTVCLSDTRRDGVFERIASYDPDPAVAAAALATAERAGFAELLREQRAAWQARWQEADIRIEGDPQLQQAVRFAMFHLMGAVADRGEAGVGARGQTGPAYRGHVFWDSDVFVLPFLAATHPAAARAMLEYRIRRLPAAQAIAREQGCAGARFPWESAAAGTDVTPLSARLATGETVPVRTGQLEEHVVADVAWAAACYLDWTGDAGFAAGPGAELLVETARYWASRVRHDPDGRAHIEGVIGPDEYHEAVDDNAFTNVMARWNLRRAAALETVTAAERARWRAVADALVDGYDPRTGRYEQFRGFFRLHPVIIAELAPRRPIAAELLLGAAGTAASQVVKQADVLMLHHLVPDEVARGSLAVNLDFYEPRTAHGSSLSPAIHAALLARAGRPDDALAMLRMAARIDLDDLTGSTAGGLHLATMGGLWQAIVFGFAGIRVQATGLVVVPRLPARWRALEIDLRYRGTPLRLRIGSDTVRVEPDAWTVRREGDRWRVLPR